MPKVQSPLLAPAIRHYRAGRLGEAETLLRRLVQKGQAPDEAPLMLAKVLLDQDKFEQARFELDRQIRTQPASIELRLTLAGALLSTGRHDEALARFDELVALAPESADVHTTRGIALFETGLPSQAEASFRRALELNPADAAAIIWLAHALSTQLRTHEAVAAVRENLRQFPGRAAVQQILAFISLYLDTASPEEVFREQRLAGSLVSRSADGLPPRLSVSPDPDRRLTVGLLSPDFRQHSCSYFIQSLLDSRDRSTCRIIAYDASKAGDEVTQRLKPLADQWRRIGRMTDADLAALIASDRVDIAMDLAGHTSGTRLAALALRPSPIRATYLGYAHSTGMPEIDCRIVDAHTDPPGSESQATETLLRLPGCFLCYAPPADAPDVSPPPCASGAPVTFGSFNALAKINPGVIDLWARILQSVPNSRLILKARPLGDPPVRARVHDLFASRGIESSRIELLSWAPAVQGHLALYHRIDIALDTFPYNGTTTTCEALWMGVPVVTLIGDRHAARVGVSLLSAVGSPDLIAPSADDYVKVATALALDTPRLANLRATLRQRMATSPLCNGTDHAARFESALRQVWRGWCAGQKSKKT